MLMLGEVVVVRKEKVGCVGSMGGISVVGYGSGWRGKGTAVDDWGIYHGGVCCEFCLGYLV